MSIYIHAIKSKQDCQTILAQIIAAEQEDINTLTLVDKSILGTQQKIVSTQEAIEIIDCYSVNLPDIA